MRQHEKKKKIQSRGNSQDWEPQLLRRAKRGVEGGEVGEGGRGLSAHVRLRSTAFVCLWGNEDLLRDFKHGHGMLRFAF